LKSRKWKRRAQHLNHNFNRLTFKVFCPSSPAAARFLPFMPRPLDEASLFATSVSLLKNAVDERIDFSGPPPFLAFLSTFVNETRRYSVT
jgi:hypothetical protein